MQMQSLGNQEKISRHGVPRSTQPPDQIISSARVGVFLASTRLLNSSSPSLSGSMIRILVGKEEKEYCAHKYYLVMTSRFFRAALANPWEDNQGTVRLPEQKPEAFARYLHYAYHNVITTKPEVDKIEDQSAEFEPT